MNKNKEIIQIRLQVISLLALVVAIIFPALLTAGDVYKAMLSILRITDSIELRIASFSFEFGLLMLVIFSETNEKSGFRFYFDKIITIVITIGIAVVNSLYLQEAGKELSYSWWLSKLVGAGFPFAIFALSEKFASNLRKLIANIKAYSEMLHKENDTILELRELLSKSDVANAGKIKEIEELQNAAKEVERQHNELLTKAKSEYAELLEHCNNLQSALQIITNNEAVYAAKIDELIQEVENLSTTKSELNATIEILSTTKDGLSTKIEDLSATKYDLSTDVENLSTTKGGLSTEIENLSTAKKGLSTEIENLSTIKDGLSTEIENLSTVKKGLNTEIENLSTKRTTEGANDKSIEDMLGEIASLQKENELLSDIIKNPTFSFDIENSFTDIFYITKRIKENEAKGKSDLATSAKKELIQFLPTICKLA